MAQRQEVFEASTDFTRRDRGGVPDPRPGDAARSPSASRSCATPRRRAVLAESIAGELISSEIEIRSGRGANLADALARQHDARARLFRLAADAACCSAPPARTRGAPGRSSRSSTPSTTAAWRRASSTSPGATTPSASTCTWASAAPTGRSPSATGCGRCCRSCWRVSANSPFLDGARLRPALGRARQIFTKSFPRCGIPEPSASFAGLRGLRRLPDPHATRSSSTPSSGGASARTTRFGTVEVRICDAQIERRGVDRAGRPARRLRRPGRARLRRGRRRSSRPPGRLIEENFWRAIRYGLDGR